MYDWEIHNTIREYQEVLPASIYISICNSSPQLNHIRYDPYSGHHEMWSENGEYFRFQVVPD